MFCLRKREYYAKNLFRKVFAKKAERPNIPGKLSAVSYQLSEKLAKKSNPLRLLILFFVLLKAER
jgi:hypothetical protein